MHRNSTASTLSYHVARATTSDAQAARLDAAAPGDASAMSNRTEPFALSLVEGQRGVRF